MLGGTPLSTAAPGACVRGRGRRRAPADALHAGARAGARGAAVPRGATQRLASSGRRRDDRRAGPWRRADADPTRGAGAARVCTPELPAALSYTAIAEYERCAYRYHLQRVIGLPDVEAPGAGARRRRGGARGVVVHALLERLDFAGAGSPERARGRRAAARRAGVELERGEDRAALASSGRRRSRAARCARGSPAPREVRREQRVRVRCSRRRGSCCAASSTSPRVEPDGTLLIVDYKSDRVAARRTDLGARVERDYAHAAARLRARGAGLGRAGGRGRALLPAPPGGRSSRRATRPRERARLEALLAARLAPLRAGRFEVSADPNRERCGSCPGRARLCSHEEVMTLRERASSSAAFSARCGPYRAALTARIRVRLRCPQPRSAGQRRVGMHSQMTRIQPAPAGRRPVRPPLRARRLRRRGRRAPGQSSEQRGRAARRSRPLANLEHRGAAGADPETGDGAGMLMQMPDAFLREVVGFELPPPRPLRRRDVLPAAPIAGEQAELDRAARADRAPRRASVVLGWREVPTDDRAHRPHRARLAADDPPALHRRGPRARGGPGRLRAQALRDPARRREGLRGPHVHRQPAPRARSSTRGC